MAARGIGTRLAHDPGDPLITSHCPFCGSGQVVGRSDGTIACSFCGQNYIVRVQPAFPGAPQMPGGPGAPSDVGPDGGLMDPGMIGPDGMPVGGGMPPEEGGEEGGMPPGDDEEAGPGGEGAPPSPGDDDDSEGSPFPKGKGEKKPPPKGKKEGALYRGLQGQPLTEGQLIRHLAAHASGHDPRVLSALRREAGREDTAFLAKMKTMEAARNQSQHACAGCGEPIEPGQEAMVTVQQANHVITVPAHDGHRDAAHASTMARSDWKRSPSYYAG
jgi:hypothetical protein